jgi:pyruvate dehydrogenase E1 component alpha subunit
MADDGLGLDELRAFESMLRLRRLEERAGMLYALGQLSQPFPLGVGTEAAFVALAAAVRSAGSAVVALQPLPGLRVAFGCQTRDVLGEFATPAEATQSTLPACCLLPDGTVVSAGCVRDALAAAAASGATTVILVSVCQIPDLAAARQSLIGFAAQATTPVLPILVVLVDELGSNNVPSALAAEIVWADGGDIKDVLQRIRIAQQALDDAPAGSCASVLAVRTPVYVGHERRGRRPMQPSQAVCDPLKTSRERLLASGVVTEATLADVEDRVRREIAAVAAELR